MLEQHRQKKTHLENKLFYLKDELNDKNYDVKVTNDWGTFVITPKIDIRFLRILKDNNFTIDTNPIGNEYQHVINLQDMRKRPYTKRPRNKDFNIKLAIKLLEGNEFNNPHGISYDDYEIVEVGK